MPAYLSLAHKRFGRPAIGSMPADWEWSNILPSKEEQELVWSDVKSVPNFWETLPVMAGVDRRLVYRMDAKHTLYFPTARVEVHGPDSAARQSAYWIRKQFGIEFPQVFAALDKKPMAVALKYDYFIDDRPKNCTDILSVLPDCKVYLKDSSHNQTFNRTAPGDPRIIRVRDFNEFAEIVNEENDGTASN